MDKNTVFRSFVTFLISVHQTTNDMTKDVKLDGVTPVQHGILEYIAVSGPVTIGQISDCIRMSMPNTSRELKKLTAKQLCEKYADPGDRRKQFIRLSPEGQALMDDWFRRVEARFHQRLGTVTDSELAELEQALRMLQGKVFF